MRFSPSGHAVLFPGDDLDAAVDELESLGYSEDFCLSPSFDPGFIAELARAGFLVMSARIGGAALLLPKLHLERSVLFFDDLRVPKSAEKKIPEYAFAAGGDLEEVVDACARTHGDDWLTEELRRALLASNAFFSFALRRGERLVAGEFGSVAGRVYTSYSGFRTEDSSGTAQMALAARWLRGAGFAFWDLGMEMQYKARLGAKVLGRADFVREFRAARGGARNP